MNRIDNIDNSSFLIKRLLLQNTFPFCYRTFFLLLQNISGGCFWTVLGRNHPGKTPPDPKPNCIPNLTLTLTMISYKGLFSRGIFPDTLLNISFSITIWKNCMKGQVCNFIKKETLAQVFSCEFCKISKDTFCYRTPSMAASVCCGRKVAAVKIEKLKAFIIKYYDISKTYSVQFRLLYSANVSYCYFLSMVFSHQFSH